MILSWRNESKVVLQVTPVYGSLLPLLFELNQSYFFFFTLVFIYSPLMCYNPSESVSLETASPLQVPLMAYGDEQPFSC